VVAKQQAEFEKSPAAQLLVAIEARKRAKDEMVAEHSDYRSATSQRLATLDQENAEVWQTCETFDGPNLPSTLYNFPAHQKRCIKLGLSAPTRGFYCSNPETTGDFGHTFIA
jgi:hypothetical protein